MADLIDRDAAIEAAIDAADEWDGVSNPVREASIRTWMDGVLAVDAVPVVRCKECKHLHIDGVMWTCVFGLPSGADGYCSYGKRKDGKDEA